MLAHRPNAAIISTGDTPMFPQNAIRGADSIVISAGATGMGIRRMNVISATNPITKGVADTNVEGKMTFASHAHSPLEVITPPMEIIVPISRNASRLTHLWKSFHVSTCALPGIKNSKRPISATAAT